MFFYVEDRGAIDMVMLCWMSWRKNSKTMSERWRICEMLPERNIAATQCDGQHLKMMRTVTPISSVIIMIIHSLVMLTVARASKTILSFMITQKAMEISWDLNQLFSKNRIPSGHQGMALLWWVKVFTYFSSLFPESTLSVYFYVVPNRETCK